MVGSVHIGRDHLKLYFESHLQTPPPPHSPAPKLNCVFKDLEAYNMIN